MYEPVRHQRFEREAAVHCPDCYALVSVRAPFCWRCERIFDGALLHELYDKEVADAGDQPSP